MRNITVGLEVNFVVEKGKTQKAKISEVISQGAVRLDLGGKLGSVQAQYSAEKEPGTFHFLDEAKQEEQQPPTAPAPFRPGSPPDNK